jgi:hypothetical protein
MIAPPCPHCHGATVLAVNTPFCPHCGWNRDAALFNARSSLRTLPIGLVMMAAFVFFMIHFWRFRNPYQIAILISVPMIGILVNYLVMKRSVKRLLALQVAAAQNAMPVAETTALGSMPAAASKSDASFEPSAKDQAVLRTSPPREVRMATRGRTSIGLMTVVFLIVATILIVHLNSDWVQTHSFAKKDWEMTGGIALLLLLTYATWQRQAKECELLRNGQVVAGKVVRQWENRGDSSINYEFRDYQGQTHSGSGFDYTKQLFVGMPVPNFYDRDNPQRHIAYCATLHEVAI